MANTKPVVKAQDRQTDRHISCVPDNPTIMADLSIHSNKQP